MGLFKSLLDIASKAAGEAISKKIGQAIGQQTQQQAQQQAQQTYTQAQQQAQQYSQPAAPADWNVYFAEILRTAFPQYAVKENVPVTDLAGFATDSFQLYKTRPLQAYKAEWGAPYTFVLYNGAQPAGIVMLGSGHSHDSNVKYLIARMYAKKLGLPYINFYTQMPNEREYVISRIRKFMAA